MSAIRIQHIIMLFVFVLALSGRVTASGPANTTQEQSTTPFVPAGHYTLDKSHSTITFKLSHIGFSFYTGLFSSFDATLDFDPARLETATLTAMIDVDSLGIPRPPEGFLGELLGPDWLNAGQFPTMTFRSTKVTPTGAQTAQVTGDLNLNGNSVPVTLDVTFNGGYAGIAGFDPNARIGFSAQGSLSRSAFGIEKGLPPEGTTMGVGDRVTFMIETEFTGPALESSNEKN